MKKAIVEGKVVFTFEGGLESLTFDPSAASAANRTYAELHGWMARLGDMAAISRTQKDGSTVTVTEEMRRAEILAGIEHYQNAGAGWNMKAKAPAQNPTILRLAEKLGITYEQAMVKLAEDAIAQLSA